MIEKLELKGIIQYIKLRQKHAFVVLGALVLLVIVAGFFAFRLLNKNSSTVLANNNSGENDPIVVVVGEEQSLITGNTTSNNSWPGEIISLSNLQVQPAREGTISEWYVHIGEQVRAGQVVGKLSRPPQTPDAIMSLSEKLQMSSEAQTSVEALRTFTTKRISELQQLRADTENLNKQKIDLLESDTSISGGDVLSLIASKKKLAQVILRGSIANIFPIIYRQNSVPLIGSIYSLRVKPMFGVSDSSLRYKFPDILFQALSDLQNTNIVPEKSGLLYFDAAIKLASASIIDGETLTEASLDSLKQMLIDDQSDFVTVLGEIKSMELEKINTQRESIDTIAEIDAMIAELNKELAMSEGELIAKKTAYATMSGSINGGYSIVAPTGGAVSSIMKKPGEFVGPGMPVATVTANDNNGVLVRMRMPNNIQKPKIGEVLSIVRPGFETNAQKAKLVGIGNSLDDDGSFMADAVFTETTNWPIGSSVRILEPASSSTVLIKYSAVVWDKDGLPSVWAISEADRIFAKKITIGRSLGTSVEVYAGLQNGDRYINNPTLDIKEDMFLDDIIKTVVPANSGGDDDGGMQM